MVTVQDPQKYRKVSLVFIAVVLAGVTLLFTILQHTGVSVLWDEDHFTVKAPMMERTVRYDEVSRLELRENVAYGSRTWGADYITGMSGRFKNREFGNYFCAVYKKPEQCIVMETPQGILAFNASEDAKTREWFEELCTHMGPQVRIER